MTSTNTGKTKKRRRKQLLDDFKRTTGYRKLKEEALDLTPWRIHFGRGYGPVIRTGYGKYELNEWSTNRITLMTKTLLRQCQSHYELTL